MVAHQVVKAMKAADSRFRRTNATSCVVKPTGRTIDRHLSHRERKTAKSWLRKIFVELEEQPILPPIFNEMVSPSHTKSNAESAIRTLFFSRCNFPW